MKPTVQSMTNVSQIKSNVKSESPGIPQFDGNNSMNSSCDGSDSVNLGDLYNQLNESEDSLIIPTQIQDKISAAQYLPAVATYNTRSLFPKIGNVKTDLIERQIDVGFFSEVWQKSENKRHQAEIEKMTENEGLKYISTPRTKGAALFVNQRNSHRKN